MLFLYILISLNMTPTDFQKKQVEIEEEIFSFAKERGLANDKIEAIADGVADAEAYLSSYPRIAWVGKEPYDAVDEFGNPCDGGWSLTEGFRNTKDWSIPTWKQVIYAMYGLRNNLHYNEMDYIQNNPKMGDVMQAIAWVNLSKMPRLSTSSDKKYISDYREYWRPIVQKQLAFYKPDVIIFCNTLAEACLEDFFPEGKEPDECVYYNDSDCFICVYKNGNQLLLDAYHPGARFSEEKKEFYVNSLIDTIRKYKP